MAASDFIISSLTFLVPTAVESGGTLQVGKYWHNNPVVHERTYDRQRVPFPGQDGFKIKTRGSRGRMIEGDIFYVATTYAGIYTAFEADRVVLENCLFSVTPPYRSEYINCELVSFPEGEIFTLRDGKYFMRTKINVFSTE